MTQSIAVHDSLQDGYTYTLTAPMGEEFDERFMPDLTPQRMLELGVFGGNYFQGQYDEFPDAWFENARIAHTYDSMQNFFQINASQSRAEWQRKGWIYDDDPRGWFQWYCRYYMGRRLAEEDDRQIRRWKNMTRHVSQIKKYCSPGDPACRRRQRQAVLHWAYDSTKV